MIVYASNRTLSERAACALRSLSRHITDLEKKGFVRRHSSSNGKRYRVQDRTGDEEVFGIDLSPLLARLSDLERLSEEMEQETLRLRLLRKRLQSRAAVLAQSHALPDSLEKEISKAVRRKENQSEIEELLSQIDTLHPQTDALETQEMAASACQNGCHLQETHKEYIDIEKPRTKKQTPSSDCPHRDIAQKNISPPLLDPVPGLDIQGFKDRYPSAFDYAQGPIRDFHDLQEYIWLMARLSGISESLMHQALHEIPSMDVFDIVLQMLTRAEKIRKPSAYFRAVITRRLHSLPW